MAKHGWIKLKKISKHRAFISDMKFALELLHYVMTERIEEISAVRKAFPTRNPGKLMKDVSVEDLATVIARMDDDKYLRKVRAKLIERGKLVESEDVGPIATSVSPTSERAGSPRYIPTASLLARSDSPVSPSPTTRVAKARQLRSITTKDDGDNDREGDEKEKTEKGEQEKAEEEKGKLSDSAVKEKKEEGKQKEADEEEGKLSDPAVKEKKEEGKQEEAEEEEGKLYDAAVNEDVGEKAGVEGFGEEVGEPDVEQDGEQKEDTKAEKEQHDEDHHVELQEEPEQGSQV